jgi:hypothetical protein
MLCFLSCCARLVQRAPFSGSPHPLPTPPSPHPALLLLLSPNPPPGNPIIYYGAEQGLVGDDGTTASGNGGFRQPLWPTGFDTDHPLFKFISTLTQCVPGGDRGLPGGVGAGRGRPTPQRAAC